MGSKPIRGTSNPPALRKRGGLYAILSPPTLRWRPTPSNIRSEPKWQEPKPSLPLTSTPSISASSTPPKRSTASPTRQGRPHHHGLPHHQPRHPRYRLQRRPLPPLRVVTPMRRKRRGGFQTRPCRWQLFPNITSRTTARSSMGEPQALGSVSVGICQIGGLAAGAVGKQFPYAELAEGARICPLRSPSELNACLPSNRGMSA